MVFAQPVIVLDPGHGGSNKGAFGLHIGQYEKSLALTIAHMAAQQLKLLLPDARVVLTRYRDRHVPLRRRVRLAREQRADLFVSIHLNASEKHDRRGYETYLLTEEIAHRELTRLLRKKGSGPFFLAKRVLTPFSSTSVNQILIDLHFQTYRSRTLKLAEMVHQHLRELFGVADDRGIRQAEFDVLKGSEAPAILVEIGFIDHPIQGPLLAQKETQNKIGKSLAEGIYRYLEGLNKEQGTRNRE